MGIFDDAVRPMSRSIPVEMIAPTYEFKATTYADVGAYQTGLAAETGAGWEPIAVMRWTGALETVILVTYSRASQ